MEKKKKIICIAIAAIALLLLVIAFYPLGEESFEMTLPGFACSEDSDCEYLVVTMEGETEGVCANYEEYAGFFFRPDSNPDNTIEIDASKECYCGAYKACTSVKPTFFEKIRAFIRTVRRRFSFGMVME